ncbi:MAG TPA: hypothetical protein VIJ22_17410 [Polyangiaceae bacterium]
MRTSPQLDVAALVIAAGAVLFTGCAKNDAATAACSTMTSGQSCEVCCTTNGASGYKYVTNCSCLGGSGSPAAAPAPGSTTSFAGSYSSTFGRAVVVQTGNDVTVTYARGSAKCTAAGNALDCSWREGATSGKAKLVKETGGTIRGTWGNGSSAIDGGAWVFTPST